MEQSFPLVDAPVWTPGGRTFGNDPHLGTWRPTGVPVRQTVEIRRSGKRTLNEKPLLRTGREAEFTQDSHFAGSVEETGHCGAIKRSGQTDTPHPGRSQACDKGVLR